MISEGELIEIEARLRKLEYHIRAIEPHLQFEQDAIDGKRSEWSGESSYAISQWLKWNKRFEDFEALRDDLDSDIEACRADIERLSEFARKGTGGER